MVNVEYLQSIYDKGNYQECLEAVNLFLLFNPQNLESLLLKAKCEYQLSFSSESGDNLLTMAINSFEEILTLVPAHEEALLYITYINRFYNGYKFINIHRIL
jgi:hypothetical protein